MLVITIAAPKGGSGKTTTTTLLAAHAVSARGGRLRVCILDLNADQGNLAQWHALRGSPANPHLETKITNITRNMMAIRASGAFDLVLIDTPPLDMDVIENAVLVADAVVIPVRASILDIGVLSAIVEMCKEHHKPFAFLLSAVDKRFKELNATAAEALTKYGPLLDARASYRVAYINAMTVGKTGPEIDADLAGEAAEVWREVLDLTKRKGRQ